MIIFRFETGISYKDFHDVFIFLENLASAMEDPFIIDKKLVKNIWICQIFPVSTFSTPFILSPLGPIPKHDEGFKQIDNLLYLKKRSINNNIPDGVRELRYIQFQEILNLILGID